MSLFTSPREKHLWFWASVIVAVIFSTLFVGQPVTKLFSDQNIQAIIFAIAMIMIGAAIIMHAARTNPKKIELAILLGIVAVYVMFFLRLGLPERTHLMEYSVLAIITHEAFIERDSPENGVLMPAFLAFVLVFLIGVLDECIQIILPNRVFDPLDIVFNGFVVAVAIGSSVVFAWIRKML